MPTTFVHCCLIITTLYEPCLTEKNHSQSSDHSLTYFAFASSVFLPLCLCLLAFPLLFHSDFHTLLLNPVNSWQYIFVTLSLYKYIYGCFCYLSFPLLSSFHHILFSTEGVVGLTDRELTVVTSLPPCRARRHLRVWL